MLRENIIVKTVTTDLHGGDGRANVLPMFDKITNEVFVIHVTKGQHMPGLAYLSEEWFSPRATWPGLTLRRVVDATLRGYLRGDSGCDGRE